LIDRLRKEIQERLAQLLIEAEKLRDALAALNPLGRSSPQQPKAPAPARATAARKRAGRPTGSARPASRGAPRARASGAPGQTKRAVLAALTDGNAMTAGEISAATGLARPTVSTTLSRLATTGEVIKAERGYRLPPPSSSTDAGDRGDATG